MKALNGSRLARAIAFTFLCSALAASPSGGSVSETAAGDSPRNGGSPTARVTQAAGIANPASVYCLEKGGRLTIRKRGDGGEYGICTFTDGRQCEEWALWRGECPVGGIAVPAGTAPTEHYCLVTGGLYRPAGPSADRDGGLCIFPGGRSCDARDYYAGKFSPNR